MQHYLPGLMPTGSLLALSCGGSSSPAAVPAPSNQAPRCGTIVSSKRIVSGGITMSRLAGNLRPVGVAVHLEDYAINVVCQLPSQVIRFVIVHDHLFAITAQRIFDVRTEPPFFLCREP